MAFQNDYLQRRFYLHYRLVRNAVTAAVALGTALLCSYWILQGHF